MLPLSEITSTDQSMLDILAQREKAMIERTLKWAAINTGSWNYDGLMQFVPLLKEALGELDGKLEAIETDPIEEVQADGSIEQKKTGPVMRVTARPEAATQIVLTGHYDTVFPPGTFEGIYDLGDGRMNGPGLADMKGGLVVMIEALKALETTGLKPQIGYQIIITPDEETGNFASDGYLREAAQKAHIGLTYEPAMETGAMSGARKGSAVIDVVFKGKAAHAGRAFEEGCSAIFAASGFVTALEALNGIYEGVTINVGSIEGGNPVNIVADNAVVRIGARAPDEEAAAWAMKAISDALEQVQKREGISAHMHGGFYRPPKKRNAAQQTLFDATEATGKAMGLSLEFVDTGGVCEGNNVFAAGTPNIDTLGVRGGRIHSDEEFVILESFVERASLSALLLSRLADGRIDAKHIKSLMEAV